MEKEKKNKGQVWLIIVLVLLVLGLGGYLIYDKLLTNDKEVCEKNQKEEQNNEEEQNYTLGKINYMYYTKEEVLDLFKETSDNKSQYDDNKDKYTLVDIDNDGIEDLLFYDAISATNYDLWVFKGSNDGFYLTTKLLTNAHYQNTGIKKEADKDYFIIYTAHMGNENIKYIFIKENGYEEINVLDHEMNPETSDYEIEKIKDSLEWVEIK